MGFDAYDRDVYLAQKLQSTLAEFVDAFRSQEAYRDCERLIESEKERLISGQVDKEPEIFVRDNLICPCLEALGYTPRTDPGSLLKDEPKKPDIRLTGLSERFVGIVECKAINRERERGEALDSLKERYLGENTFARYRKSLEQKYLVGIATDGFDWEMRVKDLETGDYVSNCNGSHSLVDDSAAVQHFYYDRYAGKTNYSKKTKNEWSNVRDRLAENFVADFGIHNLPESRHTSSSTRTQQ